MTQPFNPQKGHIDRTGLPGYDPQSDPNDETCRADGTPWPHGRCDACGWHNDAFGCTHVGCTADPQATKFPVVIR